MTTDEGVCPVNVNPRHQSKDFSYNDHMPLGVDVPVPDPPLVLPSSNSFR